MLQSKYQGIQGILTRLRDNRDAIRKSKKGFTLAELIIVIAVAGIILASIGMYLFGIVGESKLTRARMNAAELTSALSAYQHAVGDMPSGWPARTETGAVLPASVTQASLNDGLVLASTSPIGPIEIQISGQFTPANYKVSNGRVVFDETKKEP